jgi:hypothetical protein
MSYHMSGVGQVLTQFTAMKAPDCIPDKYTFTTKQGPYSPGMTVPFVNLLGNNCHAKTYGGTSYALPAPYSAMDPCVAKKLPVCGSTEHRLAQQQAETQRQAAERQAALEQQALLEQRLAAQQAEQARLLAEQQEEQARLLAEQQAEAEESEEKAKTTLYIVAGVAGVVVLGAVAYAVTRKKRAA